ncbi:ribonuclease H-like YkuK family protein [Bacillus alkalicellulosilyticus]|uniref:ribonuclease H-like YkuK family protein n=1 Tax=Alkalihalobacterium alkalicellulosilyticum TaxID=1912214 RepID=UPI00099877C5|nr:ribonuclease H-like YkuK family protein [Bacillus alkalicellulosilyticus]
MEQIYSFHNISEKNMTFLDVFSHIHSFMNSKPNGHYRLMIGTDSQVYSRHTRFITGIVIRREGNGAWACLRKVDIPERIEDLHKKISIETELTEHVAQLFTPHYKKELISIILPHIKDGCSFSFEGHIDIGLGEKNKTKIYVEEMMDRLQALGMKPLVKPESFVAFSYANRHTK